MLASDLCSCEDFS